MAHFAIGDSLVVLHQDIAGKADVAAIPLSRVLQDGHQRGLSSRHERLFHFAEVDRQVGVPVEDEEPIAEERQGPPKGAGSAEQTRPVERIGDLDPEPVAASDLFPDLLPEMADTEDGPPNPLLSEQLQLPEHEGTARDVHEGLRDRRGDRMQSGGEPPGEDCDRQHRQEVRTTLLPSKSNLKRTSSRPASAIARRSARLS